jgi:hypothetical protein
MIEKLLHTDLDYAWTFLRIIAGLIVVSIWNAEALWMVWGPKNRRHPERPGILAGFREALHGWLSSASLWKCCAIAGVFGRIALVVCS